MRQPPAIGEAGLDTPSRIPEWRVVNKELWLEILFAGLTPTYWLDIFWILVIAKVVPFGASVGSPPLKFQPPPVSGDCRRNAGNFAGREQAGNMSSMDLLLVLVSAPCWGLRACAYFPRSLRNILPSTASPARRKDKTNIFKALETTSKPPTWVTEDSELLPPMQLQLQLQHHQLPWPPHLWSNELESPAWKIPTMISSGKESGHWTARPRELRGRKPGHI